MKNILLAVSFSSLVAGKVAYAEGNDSPEADKSFDHHVAAPANAFEIGVATGYTQGFGPVGRGMTHIEDISRAGGAVELVRLPEFQQGVGLHASK
jgi:hypothetical protein